MRSFIAIVGVLAISAVFANCTRRSPQTVPSSALGQSSVPGGVVQIPVEEQKPEVSALISQPPIRVDDVPSDAPPPIPQPPDDGGVDAPSGVPQPPPATDLP